MLALGLCLASVLNALQPDPLQAQHHALGPDQLHALGWLEGHGPLLERHGPLLEGHGSRLAVDLESGESTREFMVDMCDSDDATYLSRKEHMIHPRPRSLLCQRVVIVALTLASMFQRSAAFDPDTIGKDIVVTNRKVGLGGQGQVYKARVVGSNPFASDEALGYAPVNGEFMLKKFDSTPDRIASANERQLMELVSQDDSGDDVRRIVNFHGAALESTGEFFVAMEKLDHDLSKYTVVSTPCGQRVGPVHSLQWAAA